MFICGLLFCMFCMIKSMRIQDRYQIDDDNGNVVLVRGTRAVATIAVRVALDNEGSASGPAASARASTKRRRRVAPPMAKGGAP